MNKTCKVLVIGAGPGGHVAAIRAGQLGLDTILVEVERAGGTCLIRGGMISWKEGVVDKLSQGVEGLLK